MDKSQVSPIESPIINNILAYNRTFVEQSDYRPYLTDKYPDRKLAIVSCMDTRLTQLLMAALGLENGDAKIIKVAGAEVGSPFGIVMRSLLIAVYELGVEDVMVIGHTHCGTHHMRSAPLVHAMEQRGIPAERLETIRRCGIDLDRWLTGFDDLEDSVKHNVDCIRNHPLMPQDIRVNGFVIDSTTGELTAVANGETHF